MVDAPNEQYGPPPGDSQQPVGQINPQPAGQSTNPVKTMIPRLLVGGAFLVGSWAFFSFMNTEGCDLDGVNFICSDGSTFGVVWPVIAGFIGVMIVGLSIVDGVRQSRARREEWKQSGQVWPPLPPQQP